MRYLLTTLLFCIATITYAQRAKFTGVLADSATKATIEYGSITNLNTRVTVLSNSNGVFTIDVKEGDVISLASINHYFDTLTVNTKNFTSAHTFFLKAITQNLKEVTVTAILNRYAADSAARRKEFLKDVGGVPLTTVSTANSGAGMGINLDRFSKREKNKRKAFEMFDKLEREQYINYRFSAQLVSRYTTLRNDSLIQFVQQYRPEYKWLRKHETEEDIKYYINDCLKKHFKRN